MPAYLGNITMLKSDIHLVVRIFQPYIDGADTLDAVEFAKKYDRELRNAGLMLKYLGLSAESAQSPFGWKPTRLLMDIVTRRLSQDEPDEPPSDEDADDFTREHMMEEIYGVEREDRSFGFKLLFAIGLMYDDGFYTITDKLRELFQD
jgi:hypothetical protein